MTATWSATTRLVLDRRVWQNWTFNRPEQRSATDRLLSMDHASGTVYQRTGHFLAADSSLICSFNSCGVCDSEWTPHKCSGNMRNASPHSPAIRISQAPHHRSWCHNNRPCCSGQGWVPDCDGEAKPASLTSVTEAEMPACRVPQRQTPVQCGRRRAWYRWWRSPHTGILSAALASAAYTMAHCHQCRRLTDPPHAIELPLVHI